MQASAKPRCMEVSLSGALYGLDLEHVKEVLALRPMSRVFHAPAAIAGVANLRGEVLTVVDLGVLLAGESSPRDSASRIVVLRDEGEPRRLAGVLVDRLGALREMPPEGLVAVPTTLPLRAARLVRGVIASPPPCTVIDVGQVFATEELRELSVTVDTEP